MTVFGLGDSSVIHHDFFSVDITARALELERDPVLEENTGVELGNYQKDLYSTLADSNKAAAIIQAITGRGGTLRGDKLRGTIDLLVARLKASGSYANAQVLDNKGFLLENTNADSPDYGAMYMGPGIFAIASAKKADNSWDWKTFGGPNGFVGYYILAHTVRAEQLDADDIFANSAFVIKLVTSLVSSNLGQQLVLTSNTGIVAIVGDIDALDERMSGAEASLLLVLGEITAAVNDAKNELGAEMDLMAGEIALRAKSADVNTALNLKANGADLTTVNSNLQAQINAIPGQITLAVGPAQTTANTALSNANSAQSAANAAQQAVDTKRVGTNILPNSKIGKTCNAGDYWFAGWDLTGKLQPNATYTLTVRGWSNSASSDLAVYLYTIVGAEWGWSKEIIIPGVAETKSIVFTTPSSFGSGTYLNAYSSPNGNGGTVTLEWAVLAAGNTPVADWVPNPDDMEARMASAEFKLAWDQILLAIKNGTNSKIQLTALRALIESDAIDFRTLAWCFMLRNSSDDILALWNEQGLDTSGSISAAAIYAPNVQKVYTGPAYATWKGDPQTTIDGIEKYLRYMVTVVIPLGTYYCDLVVQDYQGAPLRLYFVPGATIVGSITVQNCKAQVQIYTDGGQLGNVLCTGGRGVYFLNCTSPQIWNMRITGKR